MRGADKLLRPIDGVSLLRRSVLEAVNSTASRTTVVLGFAQHQRTACISDLPVRIIFSARATRGMAYSLQSGIVALGKDADGVLIVLADMPAITHADLNLLLAAFTPGRIVVAGSEGRPGNPVIFPAGLFVELLQLQGDKGARSIVTGNPKRVKIIDLPDRRASIDLDTPGDWKDWEGGE